MRPPPAKVLIVNRGQERPGQYGEEKAVVPQQVGCVCKCIKIPFLGKRCARCCLFPPGCKVVSSC